MSFLVDIRGVEELTDDPDDPVRELVIAAYGHRPIGGSRNSESFYQFSYQALPPKRIKLIIGEIGEREAIGLLVDELPRTDPDDPFAPVFFSVLDMARRLADRYPEIATHSLEEVYRGYDSGEFNDEQTLAAVLMDFARDPLPGYPVVVFGW